MRIPAFIKQLAKFCDSASSRYALGGVQCKSDGKIEQLTATDGRILASVCCYSEDRDTVDVIVDGKVLASPPVAAFKKSVKFDGKTLHHGGSSTQVEAIEGKFPRVEDVFAKIHDDAIGYVAVSVDAELLAKLCSLSAAMNNDGQAKGITLFVKDAQSCVFATCTSTDGYTARLAIMPRAANDDKPHQFPARPGEQPAAIPKPTPKRVMRAKHETVHADGRRELCTAADNAPIGKRPRPASPPPEMLDDDAIAEAVAREPEPMCVGAVDYLCSPACE